MTLLTHDLAAAPVLPGPRALDFAEPDLVDLGGSTFVADLPAMAALAEPVADLPAALAEPDEEPRRAAAEPDYAAEDALVREHLPLVGYLVNELLSRVPAHVSRDDLLSAGMAALAYAARGYDTTRGVPFGRFASARIRGALIDELRSSDWASRSVRVRARRRDAAVEALTNALGRPPTSGEVAAHLGISMSELKTTEEDLARAGVLSLHGFAEASDVERLLPERAPAPEEMVLQRERIGFLLDAVSELPERLRLVVRRYFFEELPMAQIATELGVSESRVSQMRGEALELLRDGLNAQLEPSLVSRSSRPGGCAARRREAYFAAVASHSDYRARIDAGDLERRGRIGTRTPVPA